MRYLMLNKQNSMKSVLAVSETIYSSEILPYSADISSILDKIADKIQFYRSILSPKIEFYRLSRDKFEFYHRWSEPMSE